MGAFWISGSVNVATGYATGECSMLPYDELLKERDALARERERFDTALQSLTPGGSEYVNDPDRCVAYVRETRTMAHEAIVTFKKERDTAQRELAAVSKLLELAGKVTGELEAIRVSLKLTGFPESQERWYREGWEAAFRSFTAATNKIAADITAYLTEGKR